MWERLPCLCTQLDKKDKFSHMQFSQLWKNKAHVGQMNVFCVSAVESYLRMRLLLYKIQHYEVTERFRLG